MVDWVRLVGLILSFIVNAIYRENNQTQPNMVCALNYPFFPGHQGARQGMPGFVWCKRGQPLSVGMCSEGS